MRGSRLYTSTVPPMHRLQYERIPAADLVKVTFAGIVVWLVYVATMTVTPVAGSTAQSPPVVSPTSAQHSSIPAATSNFDVRGKPTISAALINQVLSAYGSPMAGQGQGMYDLGVKYGIDPAFCLAFFVHESAAGTRGEATITRRVGNIRATPGAPSADGYRAYDTWLEGADDWYRLISNLYIGSWGLTTVDRIVPVYAPSGDNNDTAAYIDDVEQLVTAWRAQNSQGAA